MSSTTASWIAVVAFGLTFALAGGRARAQDVPEGVAPGAESAPASADTGAAPAAAPQAAPAAAPDPLGSEREPPPPSTRSLVPRTTLSGGPRQEPKPGRDAFGAFSANYLARHLTRPLMFSRNVGLDLLVELPMLESPLTLPPGAILFGGNWNLDSEDLPGVKGTYAEFPIRLHYGLTDDIELRAQWGVGGWDATLNRTTVGLTSVVKPRLSFGPLDFVGTIKVRLADTNEGFGLAALATLKVPLGSQDNLIGNGAFGGNVSLVGQFDSDNGVLFGMIGLTIDGAATDLFAVDPGERVMFSAGAGTAIPVFGRFAMIGQLEFHTSYRSATNVVSVDMGLRVQLEFFGMPWFLSAGFSAGIRGDTDFTVLLAGELLFDFFAGD